MTTIGHRFERLDPAAAGTARPDPEAAFIQLYTSGTTGRPKGCVLSQRAWVASAANAVTGLRLTQADVHVGSGPFFHVAGLGTAMAVLSAGGRVVFGSTRSLDESWDLIGRHGVTIGTFIVGGAHRAARHPMSATHGKSLRILTGQGGRYSPAEYEEMGELLPHAEFAGIYGSTESGNFVTISTRAQEMSRPGTIGRPLPGFRAFVVGPDDRPRPLGMHTGDMVRAGDDGCLYLLDRLKDMVKPGGENVYRRPLGRGRQGGRRGAGGVDFASLDAWCLQRLAAYKRPRWYELADALPSNGAKVDKKRLRAAHDPRRSVRLPGRDR